jgi:hypothetical protein
MLKSQMGVIVKTNVLDQSVAIKSFDDGSLIDQVTLDSSLTQQELPTIGSICQFSREGNFITKIVKVYSNLPGTESVNPGEQVAVSSGGSTTRLHNDGTASLQSGDKTAIIKVNRNGVFFEGDDVIIRNLVNTEFKIDLDGTLTITRYDKDDATQMKGSIVMDVDGKVYLDNVSVYLGPGASDSIKRALFGSIVTAGPAGTWPFCPISGAPIQGSSQCKCSGLT